MRAFHCAAIGDRSLATINRSRADVPNEPPRSKLRGISCLEASL
jgi:hypothetical protein